MQVEAAGCPQNHTGMLCTYQWHTPTLHTWGRIEGDLPSESSPRDWYLHSVVVFSVFGKLFVNFTDILATHISLSHTVHHREIWGICKRYLGGWYRQIWGLVPFGCVNSLISAIKSQVLEVGYASDRCISLIKVIFGIITSPV